jgi:hypothetical protein
MTRPSFADERFVHQLPEPVATVSEPHDHWRESLFFVAHPSDALGDVVILTLAHFPKRQLMDSLQLGRIGGQPTMGHHARPVEGDQDTMAVGPVTIDIGKAFDAIHLVVDEDPLAPVALDLTFTARTRPHLLRRGAITHGDETIWDQSHFIQSGTFRGTVVHQGTELAIDDWWGQRDHSWGIRDHARCPLWMWLAIQLPDGMIAVWNWEYPNGAHVYTDGCFAPADGTAPVPVVDFRHDLSWTDSEGAPVSYERDGTDVRGLAGGVDLVFEGGKRLHVDATGSWCAPYGALGGGQHQMVVETDDGRRGTAIYEITGAHHHHFFPVARAQHLPPDG